VSAEDDTYERALGLIGAALDERPGEAFRAVMTPTPETRQLVKLLWAQASITALLLETWTANHPEVDARDLLQSIVALSRPGAPPGE